MKKQKMLAGLLTGTMLLSMLCSSVGAAETAGVTFPLEEETTFNIVIANSQKGEEYSNKVKLLQDLAEQTNVKINLIELPYDGAITNLNAMFTAGEEFDAIFSAFITDSDASMMAANGLLAPLNDYITEDIMPNFTGRVVAENPDIIGVCTMPDGRLKISKQLMILKQY